MKNLFVVDDDPFTIKLLDELFRKDWKITHETVIDEIVKKLKAETPDLALLNLGLRRTDGEPAFEAIRNNAPLTPLIVYAPSNLAKLGRELVKRGAFWNLTMPLNTTDLENVMNIAMSVENYRESAHETQRDFQRLEEGIAKMSLPLQDTLPAEFTFEGDNLIQGIIDLLADILEVEIVSLMLLNEETHELRIKAAKGLNPTVIRNTVKKAGEGIAGTVIKEGRPLLVKNVERSESFRESPFYDQYSTKSFVCVPLKAGTRVVGVLNANNKRSARPFDEKDLYLTTIFSHLLLLTLQNAQLHYDRELMFIRESKISALSRKITATLEPKILFHALLAETCQVFSVPTAFLFMLNERGNELSVYCVQDSKFTETQLSASVLKQWLASRHKSIVASATKNREEFDLLRGIADQQIRSWISVPIILQEKMVGSLELVSPDAGKFHETDKASIARIGEQAALAINNARLYVKLLNSLKEISEARKEVERIRRNQYL